MSYQGFYTLNVKEFLSLAFILIFVVWRVPHRDRSSGICIFTHKTLTATHTDRKFPKS